MKFYVAAKYERRSEARELMRRLRLLGHTIVGDWTYHTVDGLEPEKAQRLLEAFAKEDRAAVEASDAFVLLHDDNCRGGFVELGLALGSEKFIHVIGGKSKAPALGPIFYVLDEVAHHYDTDEFLTWVSETLV